MTDELDLSRVRVYPLEERRSLSRIEEILVDPDSPPPPAPPDIAALAAQCADAILAARRRQRAVILMYGAHLLRNGAALIIERLLRNRSITLLATNGAATIHDWEFAFLGRSTESVRDHVARGQFGTWDETGRFLHLALWVGSLRGDGYGASLGRFILEDGATLPSPAELEESIRARPRDPLAAARADVLHAMIQHDLQPGPLRVPHPWKHASILAQAFQHQVPLTVHPGVGYDIIATHPMFHGAVIGRSATVDFRRFAAAVEQLDGGVVLVLGSAVMAPQVFEKSLSCVNNLRSQDRRPPVCDHSIYVVDLQPGGQWDWSRGEPPKSHPAYYLRFCKSFARMGGQMHYACFDHVSFLRLVCSALSLPR